MSYNKIKNTIVNKFNKTNIIKLNKHTTIKKQAIFKNDSDYFILDYSNNFSNYDY